MTITGNPLTPILNFVIPRGATGATGADRIYGCYGRYWADRTYGCYRRYWADWTYGIRWG